MHMVWKQYKWLKEKDQAKNLAAQCFVSAQDKADTTWGSQLTTCSRTGACDMSPWIFAKQIGWKSLSYLNCKSMMTGKQMMHKKTYPLFCRNNHRNSDEEKT